MNTMNCPICGKPYNGITVSTELPITVKVTVTYGNGVQPPYCTCAWNLTPDPVVAEAQQPVEARPVALEWREVEQELEGIMRSLRQSNGGNT